MNRRQIGCVAAITLVLVIITSTVSAQVATGAPQFGSFGGGPFDSINLANLNAHFSIPIISRAGRGMPFSYALQYDSSIWAPVQDGGRGCTCWEMSNGGWSNRVQSVTGLVVYTNITNLHNLVTKYNGWQYLDPSGTQHKFAMTLYSPGYGSPNSGTATATDGSGYTLSASVVSTTQVNATIYTPSGGTIVPPQQDLAQNAGSAGPPYTVQDSNGNVITANVSGLQTTFTDTLGTTVLTATTTWVGWNSSPPQYDSYTYTAPNGGTATVQVNYSFYNIQTNFGVPGVNEFPFAATSNLLLVSSIVQADGSTYQFSYEPTPGYPGYTTGRIATVTLPTGGSIGYRYAGGSNGIFGDGTTAGFYRDVYDGTSTNTWLYFLSGSGLTTIYDPQNNQTNINFTGNYETQRQVWQGPASAGQGLVTVLTCWNGVSSGTCGPGATVTPPIQNRVQYTELPNTASRHDDYFDSGGLGLLVGTADYDWGYALLQQKSITYASLGNNILDRPASVVVQDGSGNTLYQTYYYYVQWALWTPPGTTPQHVAVSGARGNLTEVQIWTGSNWLYHNLDYYDTGMVHDNRDVNGQPTYYNYADSTSTCGNAFPTSVTPPQGTAGVDLTSYTAWNCAGGVPASTTDANGNTTTTAWNDPYFWRPSSVTDPSGYVSYTNYGSPNGWNTPPTWSDTYGEFNNNASMLDNYTLRDGLGRVRVSQKRQGPYQSIFTFDSVETDYDADGRPYRVSQPYVAGQNQLAPAGTPFTTTTYDALGRPLHVQDAGTGTVDYQYWNNDVLVTTGSVNNNGDSAKSREYEYDELGRLTSVCEVTTTAPGNGPCGQSIARNGYLIRYTYDTAIINSVPYSRMTVTQNAQPGGSPQQTRSFLYDPLGRLTQETNPETGTTTYAYDTDSFCPNNPGDLVRRTDAMGAFTCYGFDALHRLWGVSHWGSGYGPSTASELYYYDSATVNGVAMTNAKGRLARAITCTSCSNPLTPITDMGYSYAPRGETSDVYESTLHSGGYYHVNQTDYANGAPQILTAYGIGQFGYYLDGEGRTNLVSQPPIPFGTAIASNVSYNAAAQPSGVTLGSGDSDAFTYDPNTGRLHTYQFNVNNQSDTGTLTWNANGSLQQLQITDNITPANNQTCTYTHDDLGRILTANCGSLQSQSFSYDPFGNITKTLNSGVGSFTAAYNHANNRISDAGYSYDANGNLLTDASGTGTGHQYSWDAEGHATCIDGVVLTYDALGRMVEQAKGGTCANPGTTYQQILYGPGGGKLALMNGQNLNKAFIGLPGGATAVYNSSGLQYYRHADWLGSSRLASTPARTVYSDGAYAPFGENYDETGTTDRSFTGQNQDTVPGLYDFMFREQSPTQGRWISPDPAGLGAVSLSNPQSWNRYAYVSNTPLTATDPLGLKCTTNGRIPCDGNIAFDAEFQWGFGFDLLSMYSDDSLGSCTMDGGYAPCDLVSHFLSGHGEVVAVCPAGDCSRVRTGPNGNFQYRMPAWSIQPVQNPLYDPSTQDPNSIKSIQYLTWFLMGGWVDAPNLSWSLPVEDDHPGLRAFYNNPDCQNCGNTLATARIVESPKFVGCFYLASAAVGGLAVEGGLPAVAEELIPVPAGAGVPLRILLNGTRKAIGWGVNAAAVGCGLKSANVF